jgi:hypothetical protein
MFRRKNALLSVALCAALVPGAALAVDNNGPVGPDLGVGTAAVNGGRILCTAAINTNGSIATTLAGSFIDPVNTHILGTGIYQVAFKGPCGNIQSINGWFRLIQPDTLTTGSLPARSCTVADRGGLVSGLFITCFNSAGVLTNTSFTVSVSR